MIFHIHTEENEEAAVMGVIKARLLPDGITREEFEKWWPYLTETEREGYTVYEVKNLITITGRNQILTYIGAPNLSPVTVYASYFSVGTGAISSVSAGDTGMIGELARAVPSSYSISGNTVNISTFFGSTQANGTYTNAGIFGNTATATLGTGTLCTHALYNYTKSNGQSLTNDYLITIN